MKHITKSQVDKIFKPVKECRKKNCESIAPEKEMKKEAKIMAKDMKKCHKINDFNKKIKCKQFTFTKSKYKKLFDKNLKCMNKHCKKIMDDSTNQLAKTDKKVVKNIIKKIKKLSGKSKKSRKPRTLKKSKK